MRFVVIKCYVKYRPCYSSCTPESFLLICDIQGQKATTHCAFPSAAAPVTSHSLHLLWLLFLIHFFTGHCASTLPIPLCFSIHAVRCTPSISPWVNSSTALHWGLTHTWPNLPLAFISVCLSWLKLSKNHSATQAYWTVLKGSFPSDGTCRHREVKALVLINMNALHLAMKNCTDI